MIRRILSSAILLLSCTGLGFPADGEVQLIRSGRINEAISHLQERVKADPNDADSLNLLARAYYSIEQWDDAIAASQRALKLQPNRSEFHSWMGRAYGEKADTVVMIGAASLARKTKS